MAVQVRLLNQVTLQVALRQQQHINVSVIGPPGEVLDTPQGRLDVAEDLKSLACTDPKPPPHRVIVEDDGGMSTISADVPARNSDG